MFSSYSANKVLDHMLGTTSWTMPSQCYLALFTASTGLSTNSPSAEVSGGAYARQAVDFAAASGALANPTATITFPEATANWGTVTHAAIMDAVSGGNVLSWSALSASRTISTGVTASIQAADLDVSCITS